MILGIGIDIVSKKEFGEVCSDPASDFLRRHFTQAERLYCEKASGDPLLHLAARYAAKESFIKAIEEAHLFRPPLFSLEFCDIEVVHDPGKRPYLNFRGKMAEVMKGTVCHLSLSHDGEYAVAQVILE